MNQLLLLVPKKEITTTEIRITDNGNGIPKNILDKIFRTLFYHQTDRKRNRFRLIV